MHYFPTSMLDHIADFVQFVRKTAHMGFDTVWFLLVDK